MRSRKDCAYSHSTKTISAVTGSDTGHPPIITRAAQGGFLRDRVDRDGRVGHGQDTRSRHCCDRVHVADPLRARGCHGDIALNCLELNSKGTGH